MPKALRPTLVTLRTRSPVVIAPVENGGCGVCRNTLPTAVEQAVKANSDYECCPACGRILYLPDGTPRQRIHVRPEIAKRGRTGDVFLPDALGPKLRRFWRYKRERRESLEPLS